MPSKERRLREEELDQLLKGDRPSTLIKPSNDLGAGSNYRITQVEDGELVLNPKVGTGGNDKRHADRIDQAIYLKSKYSKYWGVRGKAKIIAADEGVHISTIQKYFKDFP